MSRSLALGLSGLVLFARDQIVSTQRAQSLQLETQAVAASVESVSNKGLVMSGVSLIGVFDAHAKSLLASAKSLQNMKAQADFADVIDMINVKAASILDDKGVTLASMDELGVIGGIGLGLAQINYIRMALMGVYAVYPELNSDTAERSFHFSAPIFEGRSTSSKLVGVYHLQTNLADIDRILNGYLPRTALLVSPQGKVLTSNRSPAELL